MAGDAGAEPGGGEQEALARLGRILPTAPPGEVWFGDDAAVIRPVPGGSAVLLATDTVVGGIDADLSLTTLADLGWKAMAVNLSDIAAMGGFPSSAVVSVVGLGAAELEALYQGLLAAADEYGCPVVGGDLSGGPGVVVTVAMTGTVDGPPVLRCGARPGDSVWVTRPLGASAAGLRLLQERGPGPPRPWPPDQEALVNAHARPRPSVPAGAVARRAGATAMIDISDGLVLDVARLARASGVGFELRDVPVAPGATQQEALGGGDDYVLVFTMPSGGPNSDPGQAFVAAGLEAPFLVGRCLADPSTNLVDGLTTGPEGWEHHL